MVLYNKNFQKVMFWKKKKNLLLKKKNNGDFNPNFKSLQCFNKTSHIKQKNRCAIYLSYATLVKYVPVLWAEQFQFPCRVFFDGFCSNWFKLVFAYPPNSQTFNQKKKLLFPSSRFLDQIFLLPLIWYCLPRWRKHGGIHNCLTELNNILSQNLDEGNMPRFFQHWRILPKL